MYLRCCLRAANILTAALALAACEARPRSADHQHAVVAQGTVTTTDPALLFARADSQYARGAYDSARTSYERAAASAGATRDSATVARALTGAGLAAYRLGQFDDAKAIGEQALTLKLRLGLRNDLAKSFNALGLLAQDRGELEQAIQRFVEARAAAEAVGDSGYIVKARGNLGLTYANLGDVDRARTEMLAQRAGAAALGDRRTEINAVNNLGMLATRVGDPQTAIDSLTLARNRYKSVDYAVGQENSLGQLAVAYSELGQPARALAYFDSALAIATSHGLLEPEADDRELMAELYETAGNHTRALDLLRRARALSESLGMQIKLGHVAIAEAHAYASLGNQQLARARAREAVTVQSAAGAKPEEMNAELYVAELAQRAGDATERRSALSAARVTAGRIGTGWARIELAIATARIADLALDSRGVLDALSSSEADTLLATADERAEAETLRGRAYARMHRFDLAVEAGRRAVASIERIRGNLNPGELRSSYAADRVSAYADLAVALLTLGRVDEAFQVADEARGRGMIEQLGVAARGLGRTGSAREIAAADSLLRRIDLLIQRLRTADSVRTPRPSRSLDAESGRITRELAAARRDYEAILDRMPSVAPNAAILGVTSMTATDVQRSLAPDEAVVEFLSAEDRLLVFIASRQRVRWIQMPIGSADLAERVHLVRELIAARSSTADAPLRDLYDKLIAPVERQGLLQGVRRLIIVPHGALTYLPFAALRPPQQTGGAAFLVQRYSILMIGSASALATLRARVSGPVAAGAAVFAPMPADLPSTREEADAVAREADGSHLSLGSDATESTVRDALLRSRIVHIASHATLDGDNPMFSSIELATTTDGTPRSNDDGRLETHEVLSLDVRSGLVFLSGCETALGGSWSGSYSRRDDYATLAQAFLFAGARNVVATLWRIDDRAAADLATRFYADLASSPAEALATAQRALLRDPKYAAPYYWAAYTVSGSGQLQ
ncbi:MAG TPA: CHAT domain-containing protein [Gemmatimonadaceae bacterium]|nr:CHAT domain-containing protein [Gemmatimonadaceae bacterium]